MSKDEIEAMLKEAEKFKEEDEKNKERIDSRNELESYVYSLKNNTEESSVTDVQNSTNLLKRKSHGSMKIRQPQPKNTNPTWKNFESKLVNYTNNRKRLKMGTLNLYRCKRTKYLFQTQGRGRRSRKLIKKCGRQTKN